MSFASAAQFTVAYDNRATRESLSDTGVPVTGDLANDPNLLQLLEESSEMILSACEVGARYNKDDLDALAASTTVGFLLRRLTIDLTHGLVVSRRGRAAADVTRLSPRYALALQMLDQLAAGKRLFPGIAGDTHAKAGLPETVTNPIPSSPTQTLSQRASRVFPYNPYNTNLGPGCD